MSRQPWNRLAAWLVDWLCISGWLAALGAVGAALYVSGALRDLSGEVANVAAFLVLILPVTLVLAWLESSVRGGTVGKRARRLRVIDASTGSRVSFRRALLRNAVKTAVPWELAHTVVYRLAEGGEGGSAPMWLIVATVATYLLPATYVVALFMGRGRTPYDWLSGTFVVR